MEKMNSQNLSLARVLDTSMGGEGQQEREREKEREGEKQTSR